MNRVIEMEENRKTDCWTLDEKMGNTYIFYEQANTLAARDYKQPQLVSYGEKDMKTFSIQRTDLYKMSDASSTLAQRDYKSATDLIVANDEQNMDERENGGDVMKSVVRRLTPLE